MKTIIAVLVAVLLLGLAHEAGAQTTEKPQKLAREKLDAARQAYEAAWTAFAPFDLSKDAEKVYLWSRRWMEAELGLAETKAGRAAALQGHYERMNKLESEVKDYAGIHSTIPLQQLAATRFYVTEARALLAEPVPK